MGILLQWLIMMVIWVPSVATATAEEMVSGRSCAQFFFVSAAPGDRDLGVRDQMGSWWLEVGRGATSGPTGSCVSRGQQSFRNAG